MPPRTKHTDGAAARRHAEDAAKARSDMTVLGMIDTILDGGILTASANATAEKIKRLCRQEIQAQLRLHDAAMAALDGSGRKA